MKNLIIGESSQLSQYFPDDYERISRNWNGGPKGHKSSRTNHYWEKVSKELSK